VSVEESRRHLGCVVTDVQDREARSAALRADFHRYREDFHRYEDAADTSATAQQLANLRKRAAKAFDELGGQPELASLSLRDYDHDTCEGVGRVKLAIEAGFVETKLRKLGDHEEAARIEAATHDLLTRPPETADESALRERVTAAWQELGR